MGDGSAAESSYLTQLAAWTKGMHFEMGASVDNLEDVYYQISCEF